MLHQVHEASLLVGEGCDVHKPILCFRKEAFPAIGHYQHKTNHSQKNI